MKKIKDMSVIEFADLIDSIALGDSNTFLMLKEHASIGDPDAEYFLSMCYRKEVFGVKDEPLANKLQLSAAENGCADAQDAMARNYYYGHNGVKQNTRTAFEWWQKAAANGHQLAAFALNAFPNKEAK